MSRPATVQSSWPPVPGLCSSVVHICARPADSDSNWLPRVPPSSQTDQMGSLIMQSSKPNQISWGTDVAEDVQLDEEKLKEALRKQKEFEAQAVETNERKRKYNSCKDDGAAPTEEEVSALPWCHSLPALTMLAAALGVRACLPGMLQQPTLPRWGRALQAEPTACGHSL